MEIFPSEAESYSSEVQSDFRQIRNILNKVKIPKSHKLDADPTDVKQDQVKFNVLASCSTYSETLLKLVAAASQEGANSEKNPKLGLYRRPGTTEVHTGRIRQPSCQLVLRCANSPILQATTRGVQFNFSHFYFCNKM